jgi:hypothetical protein
MASPKITPKFGKKSKFYTNHKTFDKLRGNHPIFFTEKNVDMIGQEL